MSFPDPAQQPPLPPLLPLPFASEDVDRFWSTPPMNGAVSLFEDPPQFKRLMNFENNPSNFAPFAQIKFCNDINKTWTLKGRAIHFTRLVLVQNSPNVPARMASIAHMLMMLKNYEIPLQIGKSLFEERREAPGIRLIHKMKICNLFYNGHECRYGEKRKFLHECPMKFMTDISRQNRARVVESIGATWPDLINKNDYAQPDYSKNISSSSDTFQAKTAFWKTKICCKWEIGRYPFGETYHFAQDQSSIFSHA